MEKYCSVLDLFQNVEWKIENQDTSEILYILKWTFTKIENIILKEDEVDKYQWWMCEQLKEVLKIIKENSDIENTDWSKAINKLLFKINTLFWWENKNQDIYTIPEEFKIDLDLVPEVLSYLEETMSWIILIDKNIEGNLLKSYFIQSFLSWKDKEFLDLVEEYKWDDVQISETKLIEHLEHMWFKNLDYSE